MNVYTQQDHISHVLGVLFLSNKFIYRPVLIMLDIKFTHRRVFVIFHPTELSLKKFNLLEINAYAKINFKCDYQVMILMYIG